MRGDYRTDKGTFKKLKALCLTVCLAVFALSGCEQSGRSALQTKDVSADSETTANDTDHAATKPVSGEMPSANASEASADHAASNQQVPDPVTITLGHDLDALHAEILQGLTDSFNETNQEGITVEIISVSDVTDANGTAENADPDEVIRGLSGLKADILLADVGLINELEPIAQSLNNFLKEHPENFRQFKTELLDASALTGIVYGLPFSVQSDLVFYNVTLLAEAEALVPSDIASFQTAAEKVSEKRHIPLLGVCTGADSKTSFFEDVLHGFGAALTSEGVSVGLETTQGEQAVSLMLKLFREGYVKMYDDAERMRQDFLSGSIGGFLGTSSDLTFTKSNRFQTEPALMPLVNKKAGAIVMKDLFLLTSVEKTEKAAKVFLAYLTREDTATLWAVGTGDLPVTEASFDFKEYRSLMETDVVSRVLADKEIKHFFADKSEKAVRIRDELRYRLAIHSNDEVTANELIEEIVATVSEEDGQN